MGKPTKTVADYDPEVLDLFDAYVHGSIDRRGFLRKAGLMTLGGISAGALLKGLSPNYAQAMEVLKADPRIEAEYLVYPSPDDWQGYLVKPAGLNKPAPGVLVIHENRGRNPYVEDVTRRLAVEGFIAISPDALTSFGGWTSDDEGRVQQRTLDREAIYWHYPHYHGSMWAPGAAVRAGDWKLIEFYEEDRVELYNLKDDIGEVNDLSKSNPEETKQLVNMLHKWQEETNAKMPTPNPSYGKS